MKNNFYFIPPTPTFNYNFNTINENFKNPTNAHTLTRENNPKQLHQIRKRGGTNRIFSGIRNINPSHKMMIKQIIREQLIIESSTSSKILEEP